MNEDSSNGFNCKYYRDIVDQWAPFTRDEEMAFREKMLKEGRLKELKDELVLRNAGLISIYGKKWRWLYTAEDAVSIGITGLYEAAETFNFDRTDVRFSSYAGWCLRKAFNYRKKEYRNAIDENSVSFDQPVRYTDTACDEDTMALGDALNGYFDPEYLALKNDPDRLFDFDVEGWVQDRVAAYRPAAGEPQLSDEARETIRRMMVTRVRHPEYTLEKTAEAIGCVSAQTGKPLSRERIRQLLERGKSVLRSSVRSEVARRMAILKPDMEDYWERFGKEEHNLHRTRTRLVWAKGGKYELEDVRDDVPCWDTGTVRETVEYRQAMKEWEKSVSQATDDYFSELFGHRFVNGVPVKRNSRERSETADRNWSFVQDMMPERANLHSAGSV